MFLEYKQKNYTVVFGGVLRATLITPIPKMIRFDEYSIAIQEEDAVI